MTSSFDWEIGDDDLPCEVFYTHEAAERETYMDPGCAASIEVWKVLAGYSDRQGPAYDLLGVISEAELVALETVAWDRAIEAREYVRGRDEAGKQAEWERSKE